MTDITVIPGYKASVEYKLETEYGVPVLSTAAWPGAVKSIKISDKPKPVTTTYLKAIGEGMRTVPYIHSNAIRELSLELDTVPQFIKESTMLESAFRLFGHAIGAQSTSPGSDLNCFGGAIPAGKYVNLGDDIESLTFNVAVGSTNDPGTNAQWYDFFTYMGCKCTDSTMSVNEDDVMDITYTFQPCEVFGPSHGKKDDATNDLYKTNHAPQPNPILDPVSYGDVSSFAYRSRPVCGTWSEWTDFTETGPVRSFTITVANNLHNVKDVGSIRSTRIVQAVIMKREMTISLQVDYNAFALLPKIRAMHEFQIKFKVDQNICGSHQIVWFALAGIRFAEMPINITPEDIIGDKITSLPITGFTMQETEPTVSA